MTKRSVLARACLALAVVCVGCRRGSDEGVNAPIRVAAAADLTLAFEALGRAFEARTGQGVTFSFGSTGLLAKQIAQGAPFDLFAAADLAFVDDVVGAGACDGNTKAPYASGRIAIWTRRDLVAPAQSLEDLADVRFQRIAIAHPEHAPYGQAAREALTKVGIWEPIEPRLVYGENVRHTLQLARTGNVEAAIVALALVVSDDDHPWMLIDEHHHEPIDQVLVVCERGANRAGGQAFADFVGSESGRAVMRRYWFLLPGETP